MRAWMIGAAGLIAAAVAVAADALRWLDVAAPKRIPASLLAHLPALAVIALAAYALAALLLTVAILAGDLRGLRGRLAPLAGANGLSRRDLVNAFAPSLLSPLLARLAPVTGERFADGLAGLPETVDPAVVRGEVARLHYVWLARTQVFTALALLLGLAVFGAAQGYQPLVPVPGSVPVAWPLLAVAGLLLIAALSRLVIDVAAEPVVEAIQLLPSEGRETRLLRRITDLLQTADAAAPARSEAAPRPAAANELLERLARAVEEGRRAWIDAVAGLSNAADALRATISSSTAAIEAALQAAAPRPEETAAGALDVEALRSLQTAVEQLTDAIAGAATFAEATPANAEAAPPQRRMRDDRLVAELTRLLREIDAEA